MGENDEENMEFHIIERGTSLLSTVETKNPSGTRNDDILKKKR
jgi:hypothetical protein